MSAFARKGSLRRSIALVPVLVCFSVCCSAEDSADAPRDGQAVEREVWETVAAYTEASHQRDLQKYLSFWHPDFLGWHNGQDHPTDRKSRSSGLRHYFDSTDSLGYEIEQLGIRIIADGDAAIVHYRLRNLLEVKETGARTSGVAHWTDYLVRVDDRWLLISDHGGSVSEEVTKKQESKRSSDRIDYVEIPVVDVAAAKRFYGEVFGWRFTDYGPDYASFSDGRLDGGLSKEKRVGPLVIFYDSDLESKLAKIKESGGKIVREIFEFPGGRRFHFMDPSGNELAIWSAD